LGASTGAWWRPQAPAGREAGRHLCGTDTASDDRMERSGVAIWALRRTGQRLSQAVQHQAPATGATPTGTPALGFAICRAGRADLPLVVAPVQLRSQPEREPLSARARPRRLRRPLTDRGDRDPDDVRRERRSDPGRSGRDRKGPMTSQPVCVREPAHQELVDGPRTHPSSAPKSR